VLAHQGGAIGSDFDNLASIRKTIKGIDMQSEHHDIDHEFPQYHEKLEAAAAADPDFAALVASHDRLDDEIRELEERGEPISDEELEKMKFTRIGLKDQIYARLRQV
jgi:hypothetical protein